jgi:hypothetical protein
MRSNALLPRFGAVLVLAVLGWSPGAIAAPAPPAAVVSVVTSQGRTLLSVTARDISLQTLLAEIARRADFEVVGAAPTERVISVEFARVPLDRALRGLLSADSFVLLSAPPVAGGDSKLLRVILLGPAHPGSGAASLNPAPDRVDGAQVVPDEAPPATELPEWAAAFNPDGPLDELLPLTTHADPRMRTAALEALTLHPEDERARQALIAHLGDPDLHIRTVALGLLGPFIMEWPGAEDVVVTALGDPAPLMRQLALLTLSEASSPRAVDALQRALQDEDSGVRDRAAELLDEALSVDPGAARPESGSVSSEGG